MFFSKECRVVNESLNSSGYYCWPNFFFGGKKNFAKKSVNFLFWNIASLEEEIFT